MNPRDRELTDTIIGFLSSIGIVPRLTTLPSSTLLPGVTIASGSLLVDPDRLIWPGDLLHEAGHLAVAPAELRSSMNGELPELEALHAGEVEATAWAFAATVAIGLDPSVLFHEGGYGGKSSGLAFTYSIGGYPGAGGLREAGMTLSTADAAGTGISPYPHMIRWLRF